MCRIPFLALNGSIRNKSRLEMVRTVCNSVIQFLKVVENATYIIRPRHPWSEAPE